MTGPEGMVLKGTVYVDQDSTLEVNPPPPMTEGDALVTIEDLYPLVKRYGGDFYSMPKDGGMIPPSARLQFPHVGIWAVPEGDGYIGLSLPGKGPAVEEGPILVLLRLPRTDAAALWVEKAIRRTLEAVKEHHESICWDLQDSWREGSDASQNDGGKPCPWPERTK